MLLRVFLFFSVIIFLLCGVSVGVFFIDKFKIKNIIISGNSFLKENEIRWRVESTMSAKIFGIIPQDRFFSFSPEKAKDDLLFQFGRLSSAEVIKDIPSTILVSVKERESFALLCLLNTKDCHFVDETGFIFEKAPFFSSGVFVKFFDERSAKPVEGQFLINQETLKRLFSFLDKVSAFFDVTEIYLDDDGVYKLRTVGGLDLILDKADDWDLVFSNFETFFGNYKDSGHLDFEYIDLRFGNKVFYKTK